MKQLYCNELIKKLQFIRQNRCSLSDDDKMVIDEVIFLLRTLITQVEEKPESGYETAAKVIELLLRFFLLSEEIASVIQNMS